jgi:hypothetical protein
MTTALSRIIETAPAPLVVYQRTMSLTAGGSQEPPETATPELDEELTDPDDDESPLVDELDELDELESDEVDVAALAVAPDEDDADTPGMVSALTVPKMPTPAIPAKAT